MGNAPENPTPGEDETQAIMSDPEEYAAVLAGIAEVDRGEGIEMTKDEFLAYLRDAGDNA